MAGEQILIVDDDPAWQNELELLLKDAGYVIKIVDTRPKGVIALKRRAPMAAVVDVSLIPLDSTDRQGETIMEKAAMPVVCVSAYLEPGEVGGLFHKKLARWFFSKDDLGKNPKKQEEFRRAVAQAVAESKVMHRKEMIREVRRRRDGD